jgi:hypothetical protein
LQLTCSTNPLEERITETAIPVLTDETSQPETSRHLHGPCHPHDQLPSFRSPFIGLNVAALDWSLFHDRAVHSLALLACSVLPGGHGSFIEPKSVNNGLRWASRGKQGDHLFSLFFLYT